MPKRVTSFSFTEAASRYAGPLRGFIRKRVRRQCDVDDVAQEVYLRLLKSDCDPERIEKPLEYVLGVAYHTVIDHHRTERLREERFPLSGNVEEICGDQASEALEDKPEEALVIQQEIQEALKGLPASHAIALVLCKRDGLSHREIAEIMKREEDTIRKYIHGAYVALRMREWAKEDGETHD